MRLPVFKSKYDKLGFWGWFLYIPFLMLWFWLGNNGYDRTLPLLLLFIPILKVIFYFFEEIKNVKRLKKDNKEGKYLDPYERERLSSIPKYIVFLTLIFLLLSFLIYYASKDYIAIK
jgi:hypothetical protein